MVVLPARRPFAVPYDPTVGWFVAEDRDVFWWSSPRSTSPSPPPDVLEVPVVRFDLPAAEAMMTLGRGTAVAYPDTRGDGAPSSTPSAGPADRRRTRPRPPARDAGAVTARVAVVVHEGRRSGPPLFALGVIDQLVRPTSDLSVVLLDGGELVEDFNRTVPDPGVDRGRRRGRGAPGAGWPT